jgi:2-polyprenyl-6-methoxyphenol hydroxylase-like FAD-dependent oxidoreductase
MEINHAERPHWTICLKCHGQGKIPREPSKKKYHLFQIELGNYETSGCVGAAPHPPAKNVDVCFHCAGSGLVSSENAVVADSKKYPHIAIIGGGIGGAALAVGCLHRGIPFTLYERDKSFDARSQGYGLTLQQASKAIQGLGIFSLDDGITSTKHVVYNQNGKIIGEWGLRKWKKETIEKTTKRKNVHIARQKLRSLLLQELGDSESLKWGHTLTGLSYNESGKADLSFQAGEQQKNAQADLVVGADGIRSVVRELVIGGQKNPLHYLDCIVILGICPIKFIGKSLSDATKPLFDSATVFQTVNGRERIYVMPYDTDAIMWQLSFPMSEMEAKKLSAQGAKAMKDEACRRLLTWHDPIPQILAATSESQITGYPVYDRKPFEAALLEEKGNVTLLGDAAHPMSPFKGQGANQALLDALALARKISLECDRNPLWREAGIRKSILTAFEEEMTRRSASKVESSAKAARLLHSDAVLHEGDEPRGRGLDADL